MPTISPQEVTQLLAAWGKGDPSALDKLFPLVHAELRRIARRQMSHERPGHTLQATALVNEAYLKLAGQEGFEWQSRAHFFAVCAQVMRHLLIDHARGHARDKRGGGAVQVSLNEAAMINGQPPEHFLALDEALSTLELVDPQKGKIVELRYFGGLSIEETAELLNISPRTVRREARETVKTVSEKEPCQYTRLKPGENEMTFEAKPKLAVENPAEQRSTTNRQRYQCKRDRHACSARVAPVNTAKEIRTS